jgi:molecular chaperone Hsp33
VASFAAIITNRSGIVMKNSSKLMSFMDKEKTFVLHFLEGQQLIDDLNQIHGAQGQASRFLKDSVLSAVPLIAFLKPGENLGLYIDNKEPYFLFKIEMNETGQLRTLLLSEDLNIFPEKLQGEGRLSKIFKNQLTPYTSIIDINGLDFHHVVSKILTDSYQMSAEVLISDFLNQSVLISILPNFNIDKHEDDQEGPKNDLKQVLEKQRTLIQKLFSEKIEDSKDIQTYLEKRDFLYLTGKETFFKCNCSKERMLSGIISLTQSHTLEEIFEGDQSLETQCDYCHQKYDISEKEIKKQMNSLKN